MSRLLQRVASSIFKQTQQLGQQTRLVSTQQNSTPAVKGLQQFFENGASLPEQTWTGKSTRTRGCSGGERRENKEEKIKYTWAQLPRPNETQPKSSASLFLGTMATLHSPPCWL